MEEEKKRIVIDENREIIDGEKLPMRGQAIILRYRTIKKSPGFGWWSAIVLLEDHNKKQVSFYRWKKSGDQWKQDKKLTFRRYKDWLEFKGAIEPFFKEID